MTTKNLSEVANYIYDNGLLYKFGTGANAISTEACLAQKRFVEKKFDLTPEEFFKAFKLAEDIDREQDAAECAFLLAHPELNP